MREISIAITCLLLGGLAGFLAGRFVLLQKNGRLYSFLSNLDNIILLISGIVATISIVFSVLSNNSGIATIVLNVFGTIIFSWILTKKSAKEEFREHEQDLAMRAYRHINYIESAADSAYQTLEKYTDKGNAFDNILTREILNNVMGQIRYIKGGVNTCTMDWVDMLTDEQRLQIKRETAGKDGLNEFGTQQTILADNQVNQEFV